MRFIEDLCPPALLYLIFLVVQLGFDASLGLWVTFVVKAIFGLAAVAFLDMFCGIGLGVVSWFIVAAPFVITAVGTAIALGTNFDARVLGREGFEGDVKRLSKMEPGIPESSNSITE